jgi:type IV pilus assembly protein PilE
LVELMIAVVVVGVLTALAYSSYRSGVIKGRRGSAQAYLLDVAQKEQQYLLDARAYATTLTALGSTAPSDVSPYYTITLCQASSGTCGTPGGTPPAFAVIATPIAGTSQASDGTLSIDNTGAKATTSTSYTW